jgi:hypothetical protein
MNDEGCTHLFSYKPFRNELGLLADLSDFRMRSRGRVIVYTYEASGGAMFRTRPVIVAVNSPPNRY